MIINVKKFADLKTDQVKIKCIKCMHAFSKKLLKKVSEQIIKSKHEFAMF